MKIKILNLSFHYTNKSMTQPKLAIEWSKPSEQAVSLMQSSDYVFVKELLGDKIDPLIKKMLYEFCVTYVREFESTPPQEEKGTNE